MKAVEEKNVVKHGDRKKEELYRKRLICMLQSWLYFRWIRTRLPFAAAQHTYNISIQCRCRPLTFLQAQFLCLFFLHVAQLLLTTPLCLMDSCEIKSGIYWTFLSLMYNSLLRLYWSAPWQLGKREKKHLTRYKKNFTRDRKAVEVRQEGNFIQRNARRWSCCDNNWITQRLRSFNIHPHYHYSTNSRKCRFFEMQSRCVVKSFVFFYFPVNSSMHYIYPFILLICNSLGNA